MKEHHYTSALEWTGNTGTGTSDYKSYERSYQLTVDNKPTILGSSDPSFRGDKTRHNPEELLLASIASCHMLWFLHFASVNGVIVLEYTDIATATMVENADGSGQFSAVMLKPFVKVADASMIEKANSLHHLANESCFIARSLNFKVSHEPSAIT